MRHIFSKTLSISHNFIFISRFACLNVYSEELLNQNEMQLYTINEEKFATWEPTPTQFLLLVKTSR